MDGKRLKVAIGGIIHEANSFSIEKVDINKFKEVGYIESENLIKEHRNDRRILGGYVDYAEKKSWDIVPLISARCVPAGPIITKDYEFLKEEFIKNLRKEKVDGILLHLHGAIVAEEVDDCEGDILSDIRAIVGDDVPIMMVHDLHANVSNDMAKKTDAIFGYNTQPHEDMYEREAEAAELFEKIMTEGIKTCNVLVQPPILFPAISTDTSIGAMKPIIEKAFEYEKDPDIINVSPFAGFYGSDTYSVGASVVVVVEKDKIKKGEEVGRKMADLFWERKETFFVDIISAEEAVKKAKAEGGFWGFCDEADDPLGGGPGDGTYILKKLLDLNVENAAIVTIHDPKIALEAFEKGVGATVSGKLGGKKDNAHGEPIDINAKVVRLLDKKIPMVFWDDNDLQNPGKIAVLEEKGFIIVVTQNKTATEAIDIFKYLDMEASSFNILVMKGLGESYQAVYKDVAKGFLTIDSIGVTNPDVRKLGEFKLARRPLYPLDENVEMRYK